MTLIQKNKGYFILLFVIIAVVAVAGTFSLTYAYLIDTAEKANTATVGETEIEVDEEFEPPKELKPGVSFKKTVRIKNTGNLPCLVRVRIDFSDSAAEAFCTLDMNTSAWSVKQADGYYYYQQVLKPGETATPLFTTVTIDSAMDESDLVEFEILIYAESVQHDAHIGACTQAEWDAVWQKYEGGI